MKVSKRTEPCTRTAMPSLSAAMTSSQSGSGSPLLRRRPFVKNFLQAMPSVSSEMQKVKSFVPDLNSSRRMPEPGPSPIVPSTTTLLISPTSSVILWSAPETPRPKMRLPLSCTTTGSCRSSCFLAGFFAGLDGFAAAAGSAAAAL